VFGRLTRSLTRSTPVEAALSRCAAEPTLLALRGCRRSVGSPGRSSRTWGLFMPPRHAGREPSHRWWCWRRGGWELPGRRLLRRWSHPTPPVPRHALVGAGFPRSGSHLTRHLRSAWSEQEADPAQQRRHRDAAAVDVRVRHQPREWVPVRDQALIPRELRQGDHPEDCSPISRSTPMTFIASPFGYRDFARTSSPCDRRLGR
jgi:hypothetical protein